MPIALTGRPRGTRVLAALAATAATVAAAPAVAAAAPANPDGCVVEHAVSNPFLPWGDSADYALAPAGDFEAGAWSLAGAAAVVDGNQPYDLGAGTGVKSLGLGNGGAATSDAMCIDETYPHFRFFARGTSGATIKATVLFLDDDGSVQGRDSQTVSLTRDWRLSPAMAIDVPWAGSAAPVRFRFTVTGGAAQVDDVYVDPYGRH